MSERIRSSNVRVRGKQITNRKVPIPPIDDFSEEIEKPSNARNSRNYSKRNEPKNNNQTNNRNTSRSTGKSRTTPNRNIRSSRVAPNRNVNKRTTQHDSGRVGNRTVNNRRLDDNYNTVNDIVDNSKGIINTILELFKDDAIDFTVNSDDYYAEALVAEGNSDMYPLIRNLTTHLAVLKVLEQHINEVLNLTEVPIAPVRREIRGRNDIGENRRVRVR